MKSFIEWLKLVFALREPTPEERVQELRMVAKKVWPYSESMANKLFLLAAAEERALKEQS